MQSGDRDPAARTTPAGSADRRAVVEQALADFEAAVAMKGLGGPEARRLYRRALAGFESAADGGIRGGGLYYNIANTYLRLGDVGPAIVNYRRALRLLPGDEQALGNLEAARGLCRVRFERPAGGALLRTLLFWHFDTPASARLDWALAAYVLFWALMLIRLFALRRSSALRWTIVVVAAVTLIVAASVSWDEFSRRTQTEGVIIAEEVILRKGNGEYYEPQLEQTLSEGVEFRLIESRPDVERMEWYHIELPDGKRGWLPADRVEMI